VAFKALFAADWETLRHRMLAKASRTGDGRVYPVERRGDLTPEEFHERYVVPGIPVVLDGAAAAWPAITKWTPDYLSRLCGHEDTKVLDGRQWTVNRGASQEAVSTAENLVSMQDLVKSVSEGGAWYGAFMELLDTRADLRQDLDLSLVERGYGDVAALRRHQQFVRADLWTEAMGAHLAPGYAVHVSLGHAGSELRPALP
jgi:hypothetical protein